MSERFSTEEMESALFFNLVLSFQAAAMQHMGKMPNPMTNEIERNMEAAQGSINVLQMLKKKTQGNLTDQEGQIMEAVLRETQLNYVQELSKPDEPAEAKEESPPAVDAAAADGDDGGESPEQAEDSEPEKDAN